MSTRNHRSPNNLHFFLLILLIAFAPSAPADIVVEPDGFTVTDDIVVEPDGFTVTDDIVVEPDGRS